MKRKIVKSALDFIKDVASEVLNDKNRLAKAIAVHIRNGIEDFHWKYLSDEDMHELNPRIRNAIYTFLMDFAFFAIAFNIKKMCAKMTKEGMDG